MTENFPDGPIEFPLMIFAAGYGTRMGPLTQGTPKPLVSVAGRAMIDYALDLIDEVTPSKTVANAHYLSEQIRAHLEPKGIEISEERPHILDTGGGLRHALPMLDAETVMTLNPDVIWQGPNPLRILQQAWQPDIMDALLLCIPLARTIGRVGGGDFKLLPDGRAERGGTLGYGGAQIIKTGSLATVTKPAFSLNMIWDQMNDDGRLACVEYPGRWCDVGRAESIPLAENLLASNV